MSYRTPTHIITGFLGVGKTTAIASLMSRLGSAERTAVLVNERGRVSLDGAILGAENPGLIIKEVSGGCICCTAGAAFDQALDEILEKVRPTRIIIEPSGAAKPGEVVDLLRGRKDQRLELRPVIGLVDPVRFIQPGIMNLPVYRDQVEAAQILAANRCDLAPPEAVEAFLDQAGKLFPPKQLIYTVSFGELPVEVLGAADDKQAGQGQRRPALKAVMALEELSSVPKHEMYAEAGWTWPLGVVFSYRRLSGVFGKLIEGKEMVVRAKGVFHTDQGWRLLEIAMDEFHVREIQYRGEARCEFIVTEPQAGELERIRQMISACIQGQPNQK